MYLRYSLSLLSAAVLLAVASTAAYSQTIPNAGFENWTGGNPDGWQTANAPGFATILQVSDAHGGSSAVKGIVLSLGPTTLGGQRISGANGQGFACTSSPAALHGFYKFNQGGSDSMRILIGMSDASNTGTGAGLFTTHTTTSSYTEFVANIYYLNQNTTTATIALTLPGAASTNTTFQVDDLAFGAASAVDEMGRVIPAGFDLEQNYPNPFNPSTGIIYDVAAHSHVKLVVRDMVGRVVATLVDETAAPGRYKAIFDASGLASGTYSYTLTTDAFSRTRMMTLLK